MESYMDELTLSKKQKILRMFGVLISVVLFPFMCCIVKSNKKLNKVIPQVVASNSHNCTTYRVIY